jgi:hypothetical protein
MTIIASWGLYQLKGQQNIFPGYFFFIFSEKAYLFNVIILQKNKRKVKLS